MNKAGTPDHHTERVVALRHGLQAAGVDIRQLAQLGHPRRCQALRDQRADAWQLPGLQLAVGPQAVVQALGQQQCMERLCSQV
jgi:hypothetical protein